MKRQSVISEMQEKDDHKPKFLEGYEYPSGSSSSNSSLPDCNDSIIIFTTLFVAHVLFVFLFILVLYVGFQRWRNQRSDTMATMISHSDVFTFHMIPLELLYFFGASLYCYGTYAKWDLIRELGLKMSASISPGQYLVHLLTCVERYLAVVHPITYLRLRQAGGVRIRNISIGCVWLICFATVGGGDSPLFVISFSVSLLVLTFFSVSFFSLSVLCVLIRPGPGEVGGNRKRVDQSRLRAFYTIMAIMGVLLLRILGSLVATGIYLSPAFHPCLDYIVQSQLWFTLPSSLVLPLLFLHRAGKLPRCKHNTESG